MQSKAAAFAALGVLLGLLRATVVDAQQISLVKTNNGETCWVDDPLNPRYTVNPGVVVTDTPAPCILQCGALKYDYAMIQKPGCLCGTAIGGAPFKVLNNSECSYNCTSSSGTWPCGGPRGAASFYYTTVLEVENLQVTLSASTGVTTGSALKVTVTVDTDPSLLQVKLNQGDGSEPYIVFPNNTAYAPKYRTPGTYVVTAQASFTTLNGKPGIARKKVVIYEFDDAQNNPTADCNDTLVELQKPFSCIVTANHGPSQAAAAAGVGVKVTAPSGMISSSSLLAGVKISDMFGRTIGVEPTPAAPAVADFAYRNETEVSVDLLSVPEIYTPGTMNISKAIHITSVRANMWAASAAFSIGTVVFTIRRPICNSGQIYCPYTRMCESDCTTNCSASVAFDVNQERCQPAASTSSAPSSFLTLATLATGTPTAPGFQRLEPASMTKQWVEVRSGDRLFATCTQCLIMSRKARQGESSPNGFVPMVAATVYFTAGFTFPGFCPAGPTSTSLSFSVGVLPAPSIVASTTPVIDCQDPVVSINATVDKFFYKVDETVTLTVAMLKGAPVNVSYVTKGSTTLLPAFNYTVPKTYTLTYTTSGVYDIVIRAANLWTLTRGHDYDNVTVLLAVQYPVTTNWTFAVLSQDEYILPANVTFLMTFSGANLPTNATAIVDFGDGSPYLNMSVTSKNFPVSHYYEYQDAQANYSTFINMSNDVDAQSFMVSYKGVQGPFELFKPIKNLTLDCAYFIPGTPGRKEGVGIGGLDFPTDYNVTCFIMMEQGIAEYFDLLYVNGTVFKTVKVADRIHPDGYNFTLYFPQEGYFNITARANNSLEGYVYSEEAYLLHMVSDVKNMTLDDFRLILSPKLVKPFEVLFDSTGGTTCLFIMWGDNSKGNTYGDKTLCSSITPDLATFQAATIVSPFPVNHTYSEEGVYTVRATAWNVKSMDANSLEVVVADMMGLECYKPKVLIVKPEAGHTYVKSKRILLSGDYSLNCSGILTFNLSWSLTEISNDSLRTVIKKYDQIQTQLPSWNKNQLSIPGLFLKTGRYEVSFTCKMTGKRFFERWPIQSTFFTDIQIWPSPLEVFVTSDGASKKMVAKDATISLPAEANSLDPDDSKSAVPISFEWLCGLPSDNLDPTMNYSTSLAIPDPAKKPAANGGGCFGSGSGKLASTAGTLTFNAQSFFQYPKVYQIYAIGKKDVRSSDNKLELDVQNISAPIPEIAINCLVPSTCKLESVPDGLVTLAASNRMTFSAVCVSGCSEAKTLTYSWSAKIKDATGIRQSVTWTSILAPRGTTNNELLLETDFLNYLAANSPNMTFTLRVDISLDTGKFGYTETNLVIVKPPVGGKCKCTVPNMPPTALKDPFTCTCSGWTDPQLKKIVSYTYYSLDGSTPPTKVELGSSGSGSLGIYPSPGATAIRCLVTNELGAVADSAVDIYSPDTTTPPIAPGSLTIQPASAEDIKEIFGAALTAKMLAENPALASMLGTVAAAALMAAPDTAVDLDTMSAAEVGKTLDLVSEAMTSALKAQAYVTIETPADAVKAASMLAALTGSMSPSDPRSLSVSLESMAAITDIATSIKSVVNNKNPALSMDQLIQIGASMMSASAGLGSSLVALAEVGGNCDSEPAVDLRFCRSADNNMKTVDIASPPDDYNKVEASDPAQIVCCAQADARLYASSDATQATHGVIKAVGEGIAAQLTEGEVKTIATATGAAMTVTKQKASDLASAPLLVKPASGLPVSITFPKDMPCLPAGCDVPLPIVAGAMPKNMLVGPKIQGQRVDNNNQIITCDIPGMDVQNLKNPIKMTAAVSSEASKSAPVFSMRNFQTELVNSTIPIVYTVVPVSKNGGEKVSIALQFDGDVTAMNLALIARREKYPAPIAGEFDANNSFTLKTRKASADGIYAFECDLDPTKTGNFILGLFDMNAGLDLTKIAQQATWDNYKSFINKNLNISFILKPTIMAGSFYDEKLKQWSGSGVSVCGYTPGESATICTNHLSTFASGFFVKPNLVDFSYVFAHAGFADNLTIYLTLIFTISVYIILVIWARMKDKKDREFLGALPLPDNDPEDKYIYEVLVQTGDKNSSGTDSKVQFILSGESDGTEIRILADPKTSPRKVFQRGALDAFVLACPRPLGHLNFLRIWHDNSGIGEKQSWFLNYMAVRDVQTGTVYEFICNNWLAVEKADGLIDRLIPVAGDPDKKNFSFLFNTTTSRNLRDNHLWFSVFMRPPRSRFTRVQRISSCMALLYLSMLTNAMFYGVLPDKPGAGALKFGPFALSPEQIGVGLMSTLICFPPTILIIQLFRKSRPRHLRKSRITEALAKDGRTPDPKKTGKIPRKMKFTFPWWCRIIAWILVAVCFCVSVFFIWAYGIQFGNDKATKWVSSLFMSFFSSILLVEPIKILALAAVFSLICKDADTESDDADEDEEDPHLEWDESYLQYSQAKTLGGLGSKAPKIDPELIETAKRKRMNEIKMWGMIKELIFYSFYLMIVVILSYGDQDPHANLMHRSLRKSFTRAGTDRIKFEDIVTTEDWWSWTQNVLMQELRAQNWYNGKPAFGLSGFLNDRANRLMGYGIIRQVRIRPQTCTVPKQMYPFVAHCSGFPNVDDEDEGKYCPGWEPWSEDCDAPEYIFKDWSELDAFPWIGELDMYSGGGYVIPLTGRQSDIMDRLEELKSENWVDTLTRALFVEFPVYNAQVNLFAVVRLSAEMIPGGGFTAQMRADIFRLLPHYEGFGMFVLVCEFAFVLFTLYFTVQVGRGLCKEGWRFFKVYWNLTEVAQIILSFLTIGSYLVRMNMTSKILKHFEETKGNAYTRLDKVMAVQEIYSQSVAGLCFLAMILFLKMMRYNKTIKGFSLMFKKCWDDLIGFGFIFLILFLAFAMMFYVFFFQLLLEWHTFLGAVGTSFSILLGKFDFSEIRETNIAAAVLFFVFNIMMSIIMINLMLAIIIMAFQEVEKEMAQAHVEKEFEIVPFLLARARTFFGLSPATAPMTMTATKNDEEKLEESSRKKRGNEEQNEKDVQEFPRKIDQMLDYVNNIYFNGDVDIHNKDWLRRFKKKNQGKLGESSD